MPYELTMENENTAYLRCWGTMTTQHAHDFLSQLYYDDQYAQATFFIRDYLDVTELLVDEDIPAYAATYEAFALKTLNSHLTLAIVAQGEILPLLQQYSHFLLTQSPASSIKICDNLNEARVWLNAQG